MSYHRRRLRRFLFHGLCLPAAFGEPCIPGIIERGTLERIGKIECIAAAISVQEGWNDPKSLVRRQHNPGALVFVGQRGGRMGKNGYAWFKNDKAGKEALLADLRAKSARGMRLGKIMSRWSVKSYAPLIVRRTGININDILTDDLRDTCARDHVPAPARSARADVTFQAMSLRSTGFRFLTRTANAFAVREAAF